jgi:hypothetical protein
LFSFAIAYLPTLVGRWFAIVALNIQRDAAKKVLSSFKINAKRWIALFVQSHCIDDEVYRISHGLLQKGKSSQVGGVDNRIAQINNLGNN